MLYLLNLFSFFRSASYFAVSVDTPFVPSGPVSLKVSLDPKTSVFHGSISSEEITYLSGDGHCFYSIF